MFAVVLLAAACSGGNDDITLLDEDEIARDEPSANTTARDGQDDDDSGDDGSDDPDGQPSLRIEPDLIKVDQFGYRPGDPKVAVIADPEVGYNDDVDFEPGQVIEVRQWDDDVVVFEGPPTLWSDGAVQEQSGDRGWWFDFSTVTTAGSYYLVDRESGVGTGRFEIGNGVYDDVFDAALKVFWFNRGNTPHDREFGGPWSDDAAYVGPGQDTEARSIDDPSNPDTALDLSGGWFDAGDTNKYVTFAAEPVHVLLTAYEQYPDAFDDAVGLPESGNGIPDVLDEIRWETEWLERMQLPSGGVLTKVGVTEHPPPSVPSTVGLQRFYEGVCSSATIAAAGMFAHAALVFEQEEELAEDAERLRGRAESAWRWYQANARSEDCDPQIVKAGDADWSLEDQDQSEVVAAVYLFALTGNSTYDSVVRQRYAATLPLTGDGFGDYRPDQSDALLAYRSLPNANSSVVQAIDARLAEVVSTSPQFGTDPEADLYRAFMPDWSYHWGSNRVKANVGSANLAIDDVPDGRERALGHLHYFHGVNPLSVVYLSNMSDYGAERSVQSLFHYWFGRRTAFDVDAGSNVGTAPGYIVGGPNDQYSGTDAPPADQPPMKSYLDWTSYGAAPAWEITEPAIYYQAAYVRLLAAVMATR